MSYIGNVPTTAAFPFDQFSGTGSQTAFTLTYAPAGTTSIIVTVTGVVQNPNTYSTVGTTLTFTGAPPSGTNNIGVVYLGLPVIGVSSPGNTAYQTAQDFTATASQTTFTTAGTYTVGFVNVYRNGARLGDADFTATTTTTVVLGTACNAGDLVTVVYFTLTSLANAIPQSGGTVSGSLNATGNITVSSPTSEIGYETGSGGTVTQLTSKSTTVTLNKPTGQITMNNAALGAGGQVAFFFNNSTLAVGDTMIINMSGFALANYSVRAGQIGANICVIALKNESVSSLSDAVVLNFAIIKGATA